MADPATRARLRAFSPDAPDTAYRRRKQGIYRRLADLEAELAHAEPDSLDWAFWSRTLELVERLPVGEQRARKDQYLARPRIAVKDVGPTAEEAARGRLQELAKLFAEGGSGDLRGRALQQAVSAELMKLPAQEREYWLLAIGFVFRRAVGLDG